MCHGVSPASWLCCLTIWTLRLPPEPYLPNRTRWITSPGRTSSDGWWWTPGQRNATLATPACKWIYHLLGILFAKFMHSMDSTLLGTTGTSSLLFVFFCEKVQHVQDLYVVHPPGSRSRIFTLHWCFFHNILSRRKTNIMKMNFKLQHFFCTTNLNTLSIVFFIGLFSKGHNYPE